MILRAKGMSYRYPGETGKVATGGAGGEKGRGYERKPGHALWDVDIALRKGETVVVLGPNGAGKTTLLHLLAGLEPPTTGTVTLKGRPLTSKGKGRSSAPPGSVGLLFQDPDDQLFMPRVFDDIAFGPLNMDLPDEEVRRRVRRAMKEAGIEGFDDRLPHHLSTGEKKRVAIAGVLAMRPRVLLMDEPTANLDPRGRRELLGLIQGLGTSVLIATHDVDAAVELADRVVVLDGTVLREGSPADVFGDVELLETAGLEAPAVARLFRKLREGKRGGVKLPLTVDEGVAALTTVGRARHD